jgi:hypothetical protein
MSRSHRRLTNACLSERPPSGYVIRPTVRGPPGFLRCSSLTGSFDIDPALMGGCAETGYLSSQTSSMRAPLKTLLIMIVNPLT